MIGTSYVSVNFTQSHGLRQIYVRSTARVYEVYSASSVQSSNDYLCTAQCGVAVRDGEVLEAPDGVSAKEGKGSDREVNEESFRNEEDWVEVKVPDSTERGDESISVPLKSLKRTAKRKQDLHEATVELQDVNPCTSLTILLLSLQSKDCVYVDELYVLADPVDSLDSVNEDNQVENPFGSSLMAMFLPTILQLSKTTSVSHVKNKHFEDKEKVSPNIVPIKTSSMDYGTQPLQELKPIVTENQDSKLEEVNCAGTSQSSSQVDAHLTQLRSGDSLPAYLEKAMERLFSRMEKIESICIGFQEQMLKPMSEIEKRLQGVEQKLEILSGDLKNYGSQQFSEVNGPDACDTEPRFFVRSSDEGIVSHESKCAEKDICLKASSVHHVDVSDSKNTHLVPFFMVKAPEFPNCDDEEEHGRLETSTNSPDDKKRQFSSIDAALSSALAGFVSSIESEAPRYVKALYVKAPNFSVEEDPNDVKGSSPGVQCESEKIGSVYFDGSERPFGIEDRISHDMPSGGDKDVPECIVEERSVKAADRSLKSYVDSERTDDAEDSTSYCIGLEGDVNASNYLTGEESGAADGKASINSGRECTDTSIVYRGEQNTLLDQSDGVNFGNLSGGKSNAMCSRNIDVANQLSQYQTDCDSDGHKIEVTEGDSSVATVKEPPHEDILHNVLGFSHPPFVIDFQSPLLDVKFISDEKSNTQPSLEALLFGTKEASQAALLDDDHPNTTPSNTDYGEPETSAGIDMAYLNLVEIPDGTYDGNLPEYHAGGRPIFHDDLSQTPRENGELGNADISNHVSVDMNYCNLVDVPVGVPADDVPEHLSCQSHERFTSSPQ